MKLTHEYRLAISTKKLSMIISLFAILGLASCQKEGSTEKTGKEIDRSAEHTEQKVEQGTEKTESKLEEIKETIVEKTEESAQYLDDSFITMKVKAAILNDSLLKVTDIKVTTVDGVVQLSGTVDSQQSIDRAIEVTQNQDGVKSVESDLIVHVPDSAEQKVEQTTKGTESKLEEKTEEGAQYTDDSVITMKVKTAILDDPMLKIANIKVTTVDSVVQLSGTVDSQQIIDRAIEVAQSQDGVKSVESDLILDAPND